MIISAKHYSLVYSIFNYNIYISQIENVTMVTYLISRFHNNNANYYVTEKGYQIRII